MRLSEKKDVMRNIIRLSYDLNVCDPRVICEALILSVMVFVGGAFKRGCMRS